ncbi:MAG: hypothetical protein FJ125_18150, partial [Deltaproteobacteria bacterium]|nr:hypothetical protein [Deltaproteobacteria bacterium]
MTAWLLEKIGIQSDITSRLEHAEWSLSAPWVLWIGLGLLVPVGWFIVRRHRHSMPHVAPILRGLLTACRIGVLLLLVVVLSGLQVRVREPAQQKPILALLVDESESMQLPAGPFGPDQAAPMARAAGLLSTAGDVPDVRLGETQPAIPPDIQNQLDTMSRRELVQRVLKTQSSVLQQFSRRCELRCYRFAQ